MVPGPPLSLGRPPAITVLPLEFDFFYRKLSGYLRNEGKTGTKTSRCSFTSLDNVTFPRADVIAPEHRNANRRARLLR